MVEDVFAVFPCRGDVFSYCGLVVTLFQKVHGRSDLLHALHTRIELAEVEQRLQVGVVCVDEFWRILVVDGGKAVDNDGGPVQTPDAQTCV